MCLIPKIHKSVSYLEFILVYSFSFKNVCDPFIKNATGTDTFLLFEKLVKFHLKHSTWKIV